MRLLPTFNRNHVGITRGVDKKNCKKLYLTLLIQEVIPVPPELW